MLIKQCELEILNPIDDVPIIDPDTEMPIPYTVKVNDKNGNTREVTRAKTEKRRVIKFWTMQWLDVKKAKVGKKTKYNKMEWTIAVVHDLVVDTDTLLPLRKEE